MTERKRNFTKEQIVEGLKDGRILCVDSRDAPELVDLKELETEGLVTSVLHEVDEQYSYLAYRWK